MKKTLVIVIVALLFLAATATLMAGGGGEHHPGYSTAKFPTNGRGRVYLYWGGHPLNTVPDVVLEGEKRGDWFGRRITARGDVNNDGYKDILIGARYAGGENRGRAYLFFGNTKEQMDSKCDWIFTGEAPKNEMGSALTIFDIDNDGIDDVLVNARYAADVKGRVYIYCGDEEFDGSKPDVILEGEEKRRVLCQRLNVATSTMILMGIFFLGLGDILIGCILAVVRICSMVMLGPK